MNEDFSEYTYNLHLHSTIGARLRNAGLGRIEQIESASDEELLLIPGIGPKRLKEIREAIAQHRGLLIPPAVSTAIPEWFGKADRDRAKVGLSPLQLAYVERLEAAVKAADEYHDATCTFCTTPELDTVDSTLWDALAKVNFLVEVAPMPEPADLPRDVIFS